METHRSPVGRLMGATSVLMFALYGALGLLGTPSAQAATINPVSPALGFNVFVEQGAELNKNETEGAIAIGGDLTMNMGYQASFVGSGITVDAIQEHVNGSQFLFW